MKTLMYMGMTLNGYIAKENDDTPWPKEEWESYHAISKKYRAIIIGRRTYEIMLKDNVFQNIGNPFTIVLTRKKLKAGQNVAFVNSAKEAIKTAADMGFSKVLISGGGAVNTSMIKKGLVDEIYIDIVPMLFGKGVKLFSEDHFESNLKLTAIKRLSKQVIQLRYRVV